MIVGHVNMAVNQVLGMIFVHQIPQGLKSPVGRIRAVAQTCRCCVRHHNVHTLMPPQLKTQFADPSLHLPLRILVAAIAVLAAAAQPQNSQTLIDQKPVIDASYKNIAGLLAQFSDLQSYDSVYIISRGADKTYKYISNKFYESFIYGNEK